MEGANANADSHSGPSIARGPALAPHARAGLPAFVAAGTHLIPFGGAVPLFPHRFLPIGDTVMCLNPVYGQGMATAGFQAKTLAAELTARRTTSLGLDGIAGNVLGRNVDVLEYPWRTAALGDFELDQTSGDRPAGLTEAARFAQALAALADDDAEVHRVSLRVQQLLDAPDALVRSGIRDRVLAHLAARDPLVSAKFFS
jgi:flavin-dependent dehydrogenase